MTDRTRVLALAGAVAVVVVVVAIVLLFGLRPYPDLPTVADQPDPPVTGQLAFVEYGPGGPCVHVVDGDGERREVGCGRLYEGEIRWIAADRLGVLSFNRPDRDVADVIDVTTGEVVDEVELADRPDPAMEPTNDEGDRVRVGGTAGAAEILLSDGDGDGDRETVVRLEGPEGYGFVDVGWTDDGRWIVAQDSIGRVVVIDPTGAAEPRIWAEDVGVAVVR